MTSTNHIKSQIIGVIALFLLVCVFPQKAASFENKLGMTMLPVKPGTFIMGSPDTEPGRKWDETRHTVTLTRGFYMSSTEVTQGQWRQLMDDNPSQFSECGTNCPVETVSWNECQMFIERLNTLERTDRYRLPTEAEWEYVCRAGSTTAFANGAISKTGCDLDPVLDKIGWYCGNTGTREPVVYGIEPKPVAMKIPNAWGFYDMHGNVQEWCLDSCKTRALLRTGVVTATYRSKKITNPLSETGSNRVIRGGSWNTSTRYARSANRGSFRPTAKRSYLGFRVVMEK